MERVNVTSYYRTMDYEAARERMVAAQIESRGVRDPRVLEAMRSVPRHLFVPGDRVANAYEDRALPIGLGQTISQPYVVAAMSEALAVEPGHKVLEIGSGSGYQAAVLATMGVVVHSMEIVPELVARSRAVLGELGLDSVTVHEGDGYLGLPEEAPFDGVIVTAASPSVPEAPLDQLSEGGLMVVPIGVAEQDLVVIAKSRAGTTKSFLFPVRFVPMVRGGSRD